jgi:3D (Asp-Asp-Asp) domain-containing protein
MVVLFSIWTTIAHADMNVWLTAYAPGAGAKRCGTTASGTKAQSGTIAVSRDVEKRLQLKFGDVIIVEGFGKFVFWDRTAAHKKRIVDIFFYCKKAAKQFGAQRGIVRKEG